MITYYTVGCNILFIYIYIYKLNLKSYKKKFKKNSNKKFKIRLQIYNISNKKTYNKSIFCKIINSVGWVVLVE